MINSDNTFHIFYIPKNIQHEIQFKNETETKNK